MRPPENDRKESAMNWYYSGMKQGSDNAQVKEREILVSIDLSLIVTW